MELISDILKTRIKPTGHTNKYFLIAEEIAKLTDTKPQRWLRDVKKREHACRRALDNLKELSPRNPAAYFTWLLRHYTT